MLSHDLTCSSCKEEYAPETTDGFKLVRDTVLANQRGVYETPLLSSFSLLSTKLLFRMPETALLTAAILPTNHTKRGQPTWMHY